jgi:hypothetical protein
VTTHYGNRIAATNSNQQSMTATTAYTKKLAVPKAGNAHGVVVPAGLVIPRK